MIYKKQFSKNIGDLYHFTSLSNLRRIMEDEGGKGKLKAAMNGVGINPDKTVSFTRDKNFTIKGHKGGNSITGLDDTLVRIKVDGNKLSERYKIKPISEPIMGVRYRNRQTSDNESEERITGRDVTDFNKYIKDITIMDEVNPDKFSEDGRNWYESLGDKVTVNYKPGLADKNRDFTAKKDYMMGKFRGQTPKYDPKDFEIKKLSDKTIKNRIDHIEKSENIQRSSNYKPEVPDEAIMVAKSAAIENKVADQNISNTIEKAASAASVTVKSSDIQSSSDINTTTVRKTILTIMKEHPKWTISIIIAVVVAVFITLGIIKSIKDKKRKKLEEIARQEIDDIQSKVIDE